MIQNILYNTIFMLNYNFFLLSIGTQNLAWWQSGYAEDCKSLYAGSIPTQASKFKRPPVGRFVLFLFVFLQ